MTIKYEYDAEADETTASIGDEIFAVMDGEVSEWRGQIPHPDSDAYEEFEIGIHQLNSPTERRVFLHLISGDVVREGFNP